MWDHPDYVKGVEYLDPEEREKRTQRITRAIDLAAKHETLPKEIQAIQEPRNFYMAPLMEQFAKEREEKEDLNNA